MATMNIKDPRVHQLAHELAQLRGSTATAAVRSALEEALAHEKAERADRRARLARLRERVAGTMDQWTGDDELYDDSGLPR